MPKYVIEREIPGAGKLSADELKGISQTSCGVLTNMGHRFSGYKAMLQVIRFTASTLRLMKRWFGNMRNRADFQPTLSVRFPQSSIQQLLNKR
jgi:hypothetical protein